MRIPLYLLCHYNRFSAFYILSKELSRIKALKILEKIRIVFNVAAVDEKNIDLSLTSDFKEDCEEFLASLEYRIKIQFSKVA